MRKSILILGLIQLIVGFLPIILELIGFGLYEAYFYLGFYTLMVAGFAFFGAHADPDYTRRDSPNC